MNLASFVFCNYRSNRSSSGELIRPFVKIRALIYYRSVVGGILAPSQLVFLSAVADNGAEVPCDVEIFVSVRGLCSPFGLPYKRNRRLGFVYLCVYLGVYLNTHFTLIINGVIIVVILYINLEIVFIEQVVA